MTPRSDEAIVSALMTGALILLWLFVDWMIGHG